MHAPELEHSKQILSSQPSLYTHFLHEVCSELLSSARSSSADGHLKRMCWDAHLQGAVALDGVAYHFMRLERERDKVI